MEMVEEAGRHFHDRAASALPDIAESKGTYLDYSTGQIPLGPIIPITKTNEVRNGHPFTRPEANGYPIKPLLAHHFEKFSDDVDGYPFPPANGSATPPVSTTNLEGMRSSHLLTTKTPAGPAFGSVVDPSSDPIAILQGLPNWDAGRTTPPDRRSVTFASPSGHTTPGAPYSRKQSVAEEESDAQVRESGTASLMSRLRALALPRSTPGQGKGSSGFIPGNSTIDENSATEPDPLIPEPAVQDEHGVDADGEDSAEEDGPRHARPRKRRKSYGGMITRADAAPSTPLRLPSTPKTSMVPPFGRSTPSMTSGAASSTRPRFFTRWATVADVTDAQRQGVSEDEGRDRMARQMLPTREGGRARIGRRLSSQMFRNYGHDGQREDPPDTGRPNNLRRLTSLVTGSHGLDGTPSSRRNRGERGASMGQQRWRQLRAGLKMLGRQKREENTIDYAKSAELIAELLAGSPAALIFASMFQRDENHRRKMPVLLEQLKLKIVDSYRKEDSSGDRHVVFRINLEYGSGLTRMKWTITRTLRDLANLHIKYKLQSSSKKYIHWKGGDPKKAKLPHFPRSAFPYLRGVRGLGDEDYEQDEETDGANATEVEGSAPERPGKNRRRSSMTNMLRRTSSMRVTQPGVATADGSDDARTAPRETYIEKQRKRLETYLLQMIRFFIFRPDANRLCRFLELSALGIRLAADGGYHGKEGLLVLHTLKGVDHRQPWAPRVLLRRYKFRWCLVRHSYIVCVESPEEMNIYDVILMDSDFECHSKSKRLKNQTGRELAEAAKNSAAHPAHFVLRISNSERDLRLLAKNERQMLQFEESIKFAASQTIWAQPHRFESFAPVRKQVFAQWLVDGRDYMWNVSRAISMAQDVIYIHDWWLSPELYLRRPAAISQKWRLDRLLQRKAQEGVKIFIIIYRNVESAIPIDSEYTKFSFLDLHPNVFVLRSPNQVRQGQFFWAHHEKICIVDHMVAFCGGIDLCFGRWDTPEHPLIDDKLTGFELTNMPKDADHCQLWAGKDYSNPRVQDFYALDKPYEEMYDRTKIPRMPWHDIGLQIVGQPARDLTRHFVQRWNFILRSRNHTRPTPFLLPPSDFSNADLEALGLDGTCEIQILRSCTEWSIGTPNKTEHSIMNAYIKMIETSEHFVYIENQFFITSCESEGSRIKNLIGDALVERIIRADKANEDWRCLIIIPLMPGFQNSVDAQDGSSIRLIMQCQYNSINRGETSVFGRLRKAGIDPQDYIEFYSLRKWGKIGPSKALVTEQLYIHAKCMVVDDRVAIIGSANINDRSMLGSRDSEIAAIIRDTDMIDSCMAGQPYRVGRFPHTLRMRLMREHLGLDVDQILEEEREAEQSDHHTDNSHADLSGRESSDTDKSTKQKLIERKHRVQDDLIAKYERIASYNHDADGKTDSSPHGVFSRDVTSDSRVTNNKDHEKDVMGDGPDHMRQLGGQAMLEGRDSLIVDGNREVLVTDEAPEGRGSLTSTKGLREKENARPDRRQKKGDGQAECDINIPLPPSTRTVPQDPSLPQISLLPALPTTDDTDIGGPPVQLSPSRNSGPIVSALTADMKRPLVDKNCMKDPLNEAFIFNTWHTIAANNTKIYRQVFRCQPDNEVKNWKDYKDFLAYGERFARMQGNDVSKEQTQQDAPAKTGPPGSGQFPPFMSHYHSVREKVFGKKAKDESTALGKGENGVKDSEKRSAQATLSVSSAQSSFDEKAAAKAEAEADAQAKQQQQSLPEPTAAPSSVSDESPPELPRQATVEYSDALNANMAECGYPRRRKRAGTRSSIKTTGTGDDMLSKADAEELLKLVQGHIVEWPYDWLAREVENGNWLYSMDQLAPLDIYN